MRVKRIVATGSDQYCRGRAWFIAYRKGALVGIGETPQKAVVDARRKRRHV